MSKRVTLPHARKFPARLSQEELKSRTAEVLKEKGGNFHFQAQFYRDTAQGVVGSKSPVFSRLQPKVKNRTEESWINAYEFIYDFLRDHRMRLTLETMKIEFQEKREPILAGTFTEFPRDQYVEELKEASDNLRSSSFAQRVQSLAESQGWPSD
jgi:hypothetical protein